VKAAYFAEPNVVILPCVDREHIESAVAALAGDDFAPLRQAEGDAG
jgi:hypothetical protein